MRLVSLTVKTSVIILATFCLSACISPLTRDDAVRIARNDLASRHLRLPIKHSVDVTESENIPEFVAPYVTYEVVFSELTHAKRKPLYTYSINKRSGQIEGITDNQKDISVPAWR